jgi:hypothetical protein
MAVQNDAVTSTEVSGYALTFDARQVGCESAYKSGFSLAHMAELVNHQLSRYKE